jgi:hypothetical protein
LLLFLLLATHVPEHQLLPLPPPRLLVGVDIVGLIEALGVFGAVEARFSVRVDIVAERAQGDSDASAEVFGCAADFWDFVDGDGGRHSYRGGDDAN